MAQCVLSVESDRLCVRNSYHIKDQLKALPGRRWDKERVAWTFPLSPRTVAGVIDLMRRTGGYTIANANETIIELLSQALKEEEAAKFQTAKLEDMPPIPCTKLSPWEHQLQAYHFAMAHEATLLYMRMGTGKTKVATDVIVNLPAKNVLIVCPKNVVPHWKKDIEKHAGRTVDVTLLRDGTVKQKQRAAEIALARKADHHVLVVNYDSLYREPFSDWALKQSWDLVVLDEIHKIKAAGGTTSRYCALLRKAAKRRLGLTGTPLPRSPEDAYAQYRFLDPGIFGTSLTVFRARYAIMGGFQGREVVGWQNQEEFNQKFFSIAYKADESVLKDLPQAVDVFRTFELAQETRATYNRIKSECYAELGAERVVSVNNALTKLLRLQQITSGFVTENSGLELTIGDEKYKALVDVLEDIDANEPVVVFCRFEKDLATVHRAADEVGSKSLELSGKRKELERWQAGEARILAVQIQSGGVGIDLTRAAYDIYYSTGFDGGNFEQSQKRTHRPGQTRNVTHIHLVAEKTVDEQIAKSIQEKRGIAHYVLDELLEARIQLSGGPAVSA
jgi:SNF2 family DNA or RNA helicase